MSGEVFAERDVRVSPLYRDVRDFYAALHAPGKQAVTDASDLSVRADGRKVSLTGVVFEDLNQAPRTRIVTVDLASGALSVHPPIGANERLPRWSPDGRTLAFLADGADAGNFQIWLACDDALPIPAPAVDGVIESLAWSPDGMRLLIGVAGYGADVAGAQGGATTRTLNQALPPWTPAVDAGDAVNLWRHAWSLDLHSRSLTRIGPERLNIWECSWLGPDRIAAVVSNSHSEGSWYGSRLVAIEVRDGTVRELYRSTVQIGVPAGSPPGEQIALIEAVSSDRTLVAGELLLIDTARGSIRRIDTDGADVTHVSWRNAVSLVYAGIRGLQTVVGELDESSAVAHESWASFERTCGSWYPSTAPLPQGGTLIIGEAFSIPPEIAEIKGGDYRVVRSLATEEARTPEFSKAQAQPITWAGRDGLEMQGILIRPDGDGPWPLVMDIHGGPVWACRNRWQGRLRGAKVLADQGIASLYPNPRGSCGRGADFARRVKGDMAGEDAHDVLCGVDALIERGIADPKYLGVTGISYGGFLSAWLVTQTDRFAAAVPISPVTNWYSQHRTCQIPEFCALFLDGAPAAANGLYFSRSPIFYADRVKTPVLQLTGEADQNTPPTQALEFHRSLLERGVESVLATYPAAGHGIRTFPEQIDATTRYVGWFLEHFAKGRGGK